jgi:hypothetical protein
MAYGHGGRRRGAGRKPGLVAGAKTQKLREVARTRICELIERGLDPLDVAVEFAHDKSLPHEFRLRAVEVALPYTHPRLSQQEVGLKATQISVYVDEDGRSPSERLMERLDRIRESMGRVQLEAQAEPLNRDDDD